MYRSDHATDHSKIVDTQISKRRNKIVFRIRNKKNIRERSRILTGSLPCHTKYGYVTKPETVR